MMRSEQVAAGQPLRDGGKASALSGSERDDEGGWRLLIIPVTVCLLLIAAAATGLLS